MIIHYIKSKIFGLKSIQSVSYKSPTIDAEARKKFKILFIDDNELTIIKILKEEYGFDISYKSSLENIYDAAIYDIILCDLHGVEMTSKLEGAALIKKLREWYPNKQIILYTAGTLRNDQLEVIQEYDDKRIQKGQDKETWEQILMGSISELIDPKHTWNRIKRYLEERDVTTKDIAIFEDIFARSYISGSTKSLDVLIKAFTKYNMIEEYNKVLKPIIIKTIEYSIKL